jgi:hypothetical protein
MATRRDTIEEAEKAGFDLSLVEASLALTPEERARQHDQALALVLEFDRIRRERDAKLESPAATARLVRFSQKSAKASKSSSFFVIQSAAKKL